VNPVRFHGLLIGICTGAGFPASEDAQRTSGALVFAPTVATLGATRVSRVVVAGSSMDKKEEVSWCVYESGR
jgi:hypothetical protein